MTEGEWLLAQNCWAFKGHNRSGGLSRCCLPWALYFLNWNISQLELGNGLCLLLLHIHVQETEQDCVLHPPSPGLILKLSLCVALAGFKLALHLPQALKCCS